MEKELLVDYLENGMKYYIVNDKSLKLLNCYLIIKAGAINENSKKNGIAHILEHLSVENVVSGFNINGYTDFDRIVLRVSNRKNDKECIRCGVKIFKKIILGDILEKKDSNKIINDVIEEWNFNKKSTAIKKEMIKFLTDGEIDQMPIGDINYINKFEFEDALEYHGENFRTNNLAVIIEGDIELEVGKKILQEEIEDYNRDEKVLFLDSDKGNKQIEIYFRAEFNLKVIDDKIFELLIVNWTVKS